MLPSLESTSEDEEQMDLSESDEEDAACIYCSDLFSYSKSGDLSLKSVTCDK
jgi:hypothetical protein